MTVVISILPPESLSQVVRAYINQFQNKIQRYSSQEIVLPEKCTLQKTVEILTGAYDIKTVFKQINYFHLQKGSVIIEAHKSPTNILLSVSVKISEQLFEGLDRELRPPGLSYLTTMTSSQDPGSVLWRIYQSPEGVLEFRHSPLPESAYLPEIIKFTFPMEIMTFSGPTLLKFNHNKGRLAFCNPMGDPPTQNPHQIKPGYSIIEASLIDILSFRKTSSSMRIYTDKLPLLGTSHLEVSRDKLD